MTSCFDLGFVDFLKKNFKELQRKEKAQLELLGTAQKTTVNLFHIDVATYIGGSMIRTTLNK